ncbi:MAG: VWA domain-containing protein [Bacteroidales bacterium]|nr:VWA domain-containing protein [Bacteroidales bacterium]
MKKIQILLFFLGIFLISGNLAFAQKNKKTITRILFILDASNSMTGTWNGIVKMNSAKAILSNMVDSLSKMPDIQMALRVYGHQSPVPPQDCNDTRLEVPFKDDNVNQIKLTINYIKPKGTTPIANSLLACAEDFTPCENCNNVVILITDGIEACDGDPCAISLALQKKGIILKPFVIGLELNVDIASHFSCIGNYINASTPEEFSNALSSVIYQTFSKTTMQVNLNDHNGKPLETNVNMTFLNNVSGKAVHNYVHTMNVKGIPDTINLDAIVEYKVKVNTIPPTFSKPFKLEPDKHTTISIDVPQGSLIVRSPETNNYKTINYIVRKSGEKETIYSPFINTSNRYITGKYDIEVLTLPRLYFNNVEIKPNETNLIRIPQVGIVSFIKKTKGYASIYVITETGEQEWVTNLNNESLKESLYLLPGNYVAVFRETTSVSTINTFSTNFTCTPGGTSSVTLY